MSSSEKTDNAEDDLYRNLTDEDGCPRCKCCSLEWVDCWNCYEGYSHHDCGEDSCCCLYPEDDVLCDECRGNGGYLMCLGRCDGTGAHKSEEKRA